MEPEQGAAERSAGFGVCSVTAHLPATAFSSPSVACVACINPITLPQILRSLRGMATPCGTPHPLPPVTTNRGIHKLWHYPSVVFTSCGIEVPHPSGGGSLTFV